MATITRFFSGGMDLDSEDSRISDGDYPFALNITKDAEGEGKDRVVSNIVGNRIVNYNLPSGINKVIGKREDLVRNRIYYFVWNSNNFHSILYYSPNTNTITKVLQSKTDSGGIDILKFNPSKRVNSVNVIPRDVDGDLLFFNDAFNEPRVINLNDNYSVWKEEYLSVAKAPPSMPPKVVYRNDNTVSINNLKNRLFQFSYRWVYKDFSRSVWSERSIVPLPIPTSPTEADNPTNNSAIAVYFSSGGANVKSIEIAVRIFNDSNVGNWQLVDSLDKSVLSIGNDVIHKIIFKNDAIYTPIDERDTIRLQDRTPKRANAGELLNGNVLIYGGLLDGFDKVDSNFEINESASSGTIRFDYAGLGIINIYIGAIVPPSTTYNISFDYTISFDERQNIYVSNASGDSSPKNISWTSSGSGTNTQNDAANQIAALLSGNNISAQNLGGGIVRVQTINGINGRFTNVQVSVQNSVQQNFFLDYAGTMLLATTNGNDSGAVGRILKVYLDGVQINADDLINGRANYVVNARTTAGVDIGADFSVTLSDTIRVIQVLQGLQAALLLKGWTFVSLADGVLTMSYPSDFVILSSGTKLISTSSQVNYTQFAYPYNTAGSFGVMYFDNKGRTNGAVVSVDSSFTTPNTGIENFPQLQLLIKHRPPLWASYYNVVRTQQNSYLKRLDWVSQSVYSDNTNSPTGTRYSYIGISNIEYYNEMQSATRGTVSYSFQQGDRIRFLKRYDSASAAQNISTKDYEIVGLEVNPIINGVIREGNFVKIIYPSSDIFLGIFELQGDDFQNYQILLYAPKVTAQSETKQIYFGCGKSYGIGNAGTANAYHIGLDQSQTANLSQAAVITMANGDVFFRKRQVPSGNQYSFTSGLYRQSDAFATIRINNGTPIVNSKYTIRNQINAIAGLSQLRYPTFINNDFLFQNTSTSPINIRCRGTIPVRTNVNSTLDIYVKFAAPSSSTVQQVLSPQAMPSANETYNFKFDFTVAVPAGQKAFILIGLNGISFQVDISSFDFKLDIVNNINIPVFDFSYTDTLPLIASSNGRATAVDIDAKEQFYPTVVRFSQALQFDTRINGTSEFWDENFDEYDRSFGAIQRLHVRERYLKVYQKFKVGNVPILTQIVKDVTGNPLQAESDRLINKIQYYAGEYGIGDAVNSLAWNNFSDYFVDDFRGVVCRLSQNGIDPISILYKTNAFFVKNLKSYRLDLNNGIAPSGQPYLGDATIHGVFDAFTNKYIIAMEQITRYSNPTTISFNQQAYTISFDERQNIFESFYDYHPEMMACLGTLLVTFSNGQLWKHDNPIFCNFYGAQRNAEIEGVFNEDLRIKKNFLALSEVSSHVWDCPSVTTDNYTFGTVLQQSVIPFAAFKRKEGQFHAPFRRDGNSQGGLVNGFVMKGGLVRVKFRVSNASYFVFLHSATIRYTDSKLSSLNI